MKTVNFSAIVAGSAMVFIAAVLSTSANAQWKWKDENGHITVSDQPPPKTIPLKNILQAPRDRQTALDSGQTNPLAAKAAVGPDAKNEEAPKSYADKELEFKKRQKETADATRKQEEESNKAKAQQERCNTLRGNLAGLESGIRIARSNAKGEREFLDDAQRQAEIERSRKEIADCK
jgi:hypothetical protein